jgi:HD-GYP domain-containing protein (c-di-GMP phosphodiesterase class II)
MVRFSDIKGIRGEKSFKETDQPRDAESGDVWLSDAALSELSKMEDLTPEETCVERDSSDLGPLYEKLRRSAKDVQEKVTSDQSIAPGPILADLHAVIDRDLIQPLFDHAMFEAKDWKDVSLHSVDVTLACLMVGKGLGYDKKKLLELGLAAFLENVGMYRIPEGILEKPTKLGAEEIDRIRRHPEIGAKILSRLGDPYEWLAAVALQVHERADGSGYPNGLKGPEISELASIIGLVDTYMAVIRKRAYRDGMLPPDAIRFILKEAKVQFPVKILKAFLNSISLFPCNTYVKLNNKSIGRVVATDRNHPLRPAVEVLYDGLGNKPEQREIVRLSDNPLLYILETIDERDLKR